MRDILHIQPASPPLQLKGLRRKREVIEASVLRYEPLAAAVRVLEQVQSLCSERHYRHTTRE